MSKLIDMAKAITDGAPIVVDVSEFPAFFSRTGEALDPKILFEVDGDTAKYKHRAQCWRCWGSGRYSIGTCFRCGGSGKEATKICTAYTAEKLAKVNAQAERRKANEQAHREAEAQAYQQRQRNRIADFEADHAEAMATIRANAEGNRFLSDLLAKLEQYGSLSDRQLDAAVRVCQRREEEREAGAASQHLGTVGERREFTLTTVRVIELEPNQYGVAYVHLCDDDGGNRVVYIGGGNAISREPGVVSRIKATVSKHDDRNGVKQTIVKRPSALDGGPMVRALAARAE